MIDPLETVIQWLRTDVPLQELVGDRIAAKHRYGDPAYPTVPGWNADDAGLMVRLDGGAVDLYVPLQTVRLETRCYAPSPLLGMQIWRRLITLSRTVDRVEVETTAGTALLHQFLQASGPSTLYDNTLALDFVLGFFTADVGEEEVV